MITFLISGIAVLAALIGCIGTYAYLLLSIPSDVEWQNTEQWLDGVRDGD